MTEFHQRLRWLHFLGFFQTLGRPARFFRCHLCAPLLSPWAAFATLICTSRTKVHRKPSASISFGIRAMPSCASDEKALVAPHPMNKSTCVYKFSAEARGRGASCRHALAWVATTTAFLVVGFNLESLASLQILPPQGPFDRTASPDPNARLTINRKPMWSAAAEPPLS
jgi:hypothetical protein